MGSAPEKLPIAFGHHGRRLIPHVVDENARRTPDREVIRIPRSSNPSDGWRPISWKSFANGVNRSAHRIIDVCGRPEPGKFPTIAYIGPNDARYMVIMVAAVKAGYKCLFVSPRNSQEGQINLFDMTDTHILAFPSSHRATVQPWLQERPNMQAVEVGSVESWFPDEELPHFPYDKTWEEAEWEPLLVLHTSGSTGFPKPIVIKHGMMAVCDAMNDLPEFQGGQFLGKVWADVSKRQLMPMPLFHAAGVFTFTMNAFWCETPVALGIADRPLSADLLVETFAHSDVESVILPPAILEDMSQSAEHTAALARLKLVVFGGGNLARDAGNRLVEAGVHLCNFIGATEFAPFPIHFQKDRSMWQYFVFNDEAFGTDWRKVPAEDNVFEQVVTRKAKHPGYQGFFYTFPELDEYNTKDLYRPHPTKPNNWIYYGRSDNIIVFSNGEKLNPIDIEETVTDHPELTGAVVVGTQRFQPGLIIEPVKFPKDAAEEKRLIDSVWPYVVRANKQTVAHGQIGRDFIAVAKADKPFLRAGKGTIQRAGTIKLYAGEIDELYAKAGEVSSAEAPRIDASSQDALVQSIEELFESRLSAPKLEPDTDFFSAGIDSMQVISASRFLRAGLEAAGHHVDSQSLATRVIYGNPTPRRLGQYLMRLLAEGGKQAHNEDADQQQAMKVLYEKYTRALVVGKKGRPEAADEGQTVLLTGSTGMLGSYLLDLMVRNPAVKKVVCLNRAEDGGAKQQERAMRERGLDGSYGGGKAEFHHVDVSRTDFGLPRDVYARLLTEADRVVHNAWPVNFNISVETFEPHLRGVRNVGDFAARAAKRVAVVFISSIGTGDRWDTAKNGPMPETRSEDWSLPAAGYGRSKMVGSLINDEAAKAGDFPAANIRVGQIAGPESEAGAWNRQEWFPSIVASSLHLRALPAELGHMNRVDWTPAERVAKLVLEVGGVAQRVAPDAITGYYHGVNPRATTFDRLADAVQDFYGPDRLPERVGWNEWVDRLERSQSDGINSVERNPGVKLIDFYRALGEGDAEPVVFDMQKTVRHSPTMAASTEVTAEDMQRWCKQWGYV